MFDLILKPIKLFFKSYKESTLIGTSRWYTDSIPYRKLSLKVINFQSCCVTARTDTAKTLPHKCPNSDLLVKVHSITVHSTNNNTNVFQCINLFSEVS